MHITVSYCEYCRLKIEIYSLDNDPVQTAIYETSITDVLLPNSMFINGIVIDLRETQACQISEQGNMNDTCYI